MTRDKLEDILYDLDIDDLGTLNGDTYTIKLKNSDDYAYYYTLLDQNENIDLDDTDSVSTEYLSILTYEGDDFKVSLNADFSKNNYNLTIEDLN